MQKKVFLRPLLVLVQCVAECGLKVQGGHHGESLEYRVSRREAIVRWLERFGGKCGQPSSDLRLQVLGVQHVQPCGILMSQ
jgi:hypothetical protein